MATTKPTEKIDLFKLHKAEYAQPKTPKLVEVGKASYLVVCGRGAPGSQPFQDAIGALYGMAYTLKFQSKFAGRDYTVGKLEALYGVDGQSLEEVRKLDLADWNWRMMIRVPEFVKKRDLQQALKTLHEKGKDGDFESVVLETLDEGRCVQMLHVGPYDEEQRTVDAMMGFAEDEGLRPRSWHHEVYLSDPRRVAPEKLRTILRLPVEASGGK